MIHSNCSSWLLLQENIYPSCKSSVGWPGNETDPHPASCHGHSLDPVQPPSEHDPCLGQSNPMALLLVLQDVQKHQMDWSRNAMSHLPSLACMHAAAYGGKNAGTNEALHACMFKRVSLSESDDSDPLESESPSSPGAPWVHNLDDKNLCMHACTHATLIQAPPSGRPAIL